MPGKEPRPLSTISNGKAADKKVSQPMPIATVTPASLPRSPLRSHPPRNSITTSPERAPFDINTLPPPPPPPMTSQRASIMRQRSSAKVPFRRHSQDDYDLQDRRGPAFESSSRRPLRARDEMYNVDDDVDRWYLRRDDYPPRGYLDYYERPRRPRYYRNSEAWDRDLPPARYYYDEKERDRELRDEWITRKRRATDVESGYPFQHNEFKESDKTKRDSRNVFLEEDMEVLRLPWTRWMKNNIKNHLVAVIGEFIGTTMFLFFALAGTQVANLRSLASSATSSATVYTTTGDATGFNVSVYLYISLIFGFSLMVNVWIFFRISGGLFNPAVTLGMVLAGAMPIGRAIALFVAQVSGAIAASGMVLGMFPAEFNVRTTLARGTSLVQGVFIEAILTAELVFTILMLAKEKQRASVVAPIGIGLALFIAEIVGLYYTGGSLNPARSLGPCVVTGIFDQDHWIYWVGPTLGSLIAVFFYKFIKMLEYETANPGQDKEEESAPMKLELKRLELRSDAWKQDARRSRWSAWSTESERV